MFRGLAEATFGLVLIGASLYLPLLGYYGIACANDGAGWAFASLILLPLANPPLGLLWFVGGVVAGLAGQPFHRETRFWSLAKWLPVASAAAGLGALVFARVTDATARCSFGF